MEEMESEELRGTVEDLTFRRPDTGFTVVDINTNGELVTAVGVMPEVAAGEEVRLLGHWDRHATFGRQFRVSFCERRFPADAQGMLKYLSSGVIKGIGRVLAAKIVDSFGAESFSVLENEPERLAALRGISLDKARMISGEFKKQFAIRAVMICLEALGMTPSECLRVYKLFGASAVDHIMANPYLLCADGLGVSFERADGIADRMPIQPEPGCRIRAGVLYVIQYNLQNGHTCIPRSKLLEPSRALLMAEPGEIDRAIDELLDGKQLVSRFLNGREFVFLPSVYSAEHGIAERIRILTQFPPAGRPTLEKEIDAIEQAEQIHYEEKQRLAITTAIQKGMLILTGGPGTGKTTTLNGILRLFEQEGLDVVLAAPTGRAAKRMSEVTSHEAKTIHRLLEVEWTEDEHNTFARNFQNPIEADALIVDELSMVDVVLFSNLLDALPLGCRLVMVGDADQLPPVGPGNVLQDLIASKKLPVIQLTEVFRQAMESLIVANAHRIVKGEEPDLRKTDADFFFMERRNPTQAAQTVAQLCASRLPAAYGYAPLTDIQVLSPSRKGELGTFNLNRTLQTALNPPAPDKLEITVNQRVFREGDKVMQIKNNYDIQWSRGDETGSGIFNGDIGILRKIDLHASVLSVEFDDREAKYSLESANELDLAYAVTVHKSQGSEFEAVVMPVLSIPPQLCYRNLLYTAVTRARKLMILVGDRGQLLRMAANDRKMRRYSALKSFLVDGEEEGHEPV